MSVSPLVIRNYPHDIALTSVFKVLGNPYDSINFPCNEELRVHVYEAKTISWKFYTYKIKVPLVKSLFTEVSNKEKNEFPKYSDIRALREVLNEQFPDLLGYGKLYDQSKAGNAYHFNRKRCPNPEPYQDCIYFSLLSRLDIEKLNRRNSLSSLTNILPSTKTNKQTSSATRAGGTGGARDLANQLTFSPVTLSSKDTSQATEQPCDQKSPNMTSSSMTQRALGALGITSQTSVWASETDKESKPQIKQTNYTIPDTPPRQLTSTPKITSAALKRPSITMCTPNLKELPPALTYENPRTDGTGFAGGPPTPRSPKKLLPKDTNSDTEALTPSSVPPKFNGSNTFSLEIPSTTTFTNFDDLLPALINENPLMVECQKPLWDRDSEVNPGLNKQTNENPSKRRKSTEVSFSFKPGS